MLNNVLSSFSEEVKEGLYVMAGGIAEYQAEFATYIPVVLVLAFNGISNDLHVHIHFEESCAG
jgi:hypothetical protein